MRKAQKMIEIFPGIFCCPLHKDAGIFHLYLFPIWVIQVGKWEMVLHVSDHQIATSAYILCCRSFPSKLWFLLETQS